MIVFNILAVVLVKKIIVHSLLVQKDLIKKTFFLSHKISTLYQGVDTSVFKPLHNGEVNVLKRELGVSAEVNLVGMVGRYDPAKGHKIFLEAASLVLQEDHNVKFVAVGGLLFADVFPFFKNYYDEVLEYARRLGVERHVVFLPHRNDIPEVMRSLDVLVLPSVNEGFGLVVLEALASSVPVVTSPAVGALELVGDSTCVFRAASGEATSFARHILSAVEFVRKNPHRCTERERISQFSWETSSQQYEQVYEMIGKR
jgi:glycosyltransferase involved in cell wall biosynthesis